MLTIQNRIHQDPDRFMLFFEQLFEDAKIFREFKSKLQEEREEDQDIMKKIERWIEDIPNKSPDEVEKIQNY